MPSVCREVAQIWHTNFTLLLKERFKKIAAICRFLILYFENIAAIFIKVSSQNPIKNFIKIFIKTAVKLFGIFSKNY